MQLEKNLESSRQEFADFQKTKKIEDLLTVKFEVDQISPEMLAKPEMDLQTLENTKSELES